MVGFSDKAIEARRREINVDNYSAVLVGQRAGKSNRSRRRADAAPRARHQQADATGRWRPIILQAAHDAHETGHRARRRPAEVRRGGPVARVFR